MTQNIHGDELANDLQRMIDESLIEAGMDAMITGNTLKVKPFKPILMEKLVIYIVRRDHLVHEAGVKVGKKIANGDLEPEEEQ